MPTSLIEERSREISPQKMGETKNGMDEVIRLNMPQMNQRYIDLLCK